jgi:hypothetical protein
MVKKGLDNSDSNLFKLDNHRAELWGNTFNAVVCFCIAHKLKLLKNVVYLVIDEKGIW